MNIFMVIAILVLNIVAVIFIYQFVKSLEKKEKVIFIAVSIAINYMIVSFIYWLSSFGIDKAVTQSAQSFVTYMFVPVNMILVMPFIANTYCKIKLKKMKQLPLRNRCITIIVFSLIVLVVEYFYFKNIQLNIVNYGLMK